MTYLLFPGRHLLHTTFQKEYAEKLLSLSSRELGNRKDGQDDGRGITGIVFAVTSANQENSRYNPIPFYIRAMGVDRFVNSLKKKTGISHHIIGIPHFPPTDKFAEYILKEIEENTEKSLVLAPHNAVVLCSTPSLIEMYRKLGFHIFSAEYDEKNKDYKSETPIEILKKVVALSGEWDKDKEIQSKLSQATRELWHDFPDVPRQIIRLWNDPLLTEEGSLTETRNYSTYALGMGRGEMMDIKYDEIKDTITPGKIVDEGCADCALIVKLAEDFPDSDIIGIEITSEFVARCKERHRAGEFGGTYVHVHQRNLMEKIFEDNSIDTTICNSTTHELWSYGNQAETVHNYLQKKFNQTRKNGRIVIRDVVGPLDKEEEVYMALNKEDGSNEDILKECVDPTLLKEHLDGLSTYARFIRFAEDYLADMRKEKKRDSNTKIQYREEVISGEIYIVLSLKDAVEFMTKKDYIDNWQSELNEEFAYWDFVEWKGALVKAGFHIIENPNDLNTSSRAWANPWIVENRFKGKVKLFKKQVNKLKPLSYPVTNMVLIGEKRSKHGL